MRRNFSDFIRNGQTGVYVFAARGRSVLGHQPTLSIKSTFPNYRELRANFEESLDEIDRENAQMLQDALTPLDTVPRFTGDDVMDVADAKDEALKEWDARLRSIFSQYQSHPQRLRPLRIAMEERLLRGFAGLINQLRQENMGITHYVWRTREDDRVRSSHATRHGQVFSWRSGGPHPGQEPNCRCMAIPTLPDADGNVVLADLALPLDPPAGQAARTLASRTPAGAALLAALAANGQLQAFTQRASEDRNKQVAAKLGADLSVIEGVMAVNAYNAVRVLVESGAAPIAQKSPDITEIAAQAAALFEMSQPGAFQRIQQGDSATQAALWSFVERAIEAFENGQLKLREGSIADGWVEVLPELTDDERRLGQLPGFTPERLDEFREEFPAEDLGLPNDTGTPIPDDPTDDVISTPIPEDAGPNVVTMADPNNERATDLEDSAFNGIREAFPEANIERNREYLKANGELDGEVDTLINGIPVEVTIGNGRNKLEQSQKIERLTGKAPIIYGPNIRGTVERNLRQEGYVLVRDLDSLIDALRDRGVDQ